MARTKKQTAVGSRLEVETIKYLLLDNGGFICTNVVGTVMALYEDGENRGFVTRFDMVPMLQGRLFRVPATAVRIVINGHS